MDELTRSTLSDYRKKHNLREVPLIDKTVFDLLIFENKYPPHRFEKLQLGARSDDVFILNNILSFFIKHLGLFIRSPHGEYYTAETEKAITEIKKHFPGTKNDSMFYQLLEYSYSTLKSSITSYL